MGRIFKLETPDDFAALEGASCAMGVFDGVHAGHRFLLGRACESAAAEGARAVALTFDIDPDELFRADSLKKLMPNDVRLARLAESGVDAVAVLPFTRSFASLSPVAFMDACFGAHTPAHLHVGCDFRFGARAAGGVDDLCAWGAQRGMDVRPCDLLAVDDAPVTATRIRGLLAQGRIAEANRLLVRPYAVTGVVESGRGEGRGFGIRTANLRVAPELRALADGVYAAYATVDGVRYKAAVNVGVAATFADRSTATCEAHILDFDGDLYGKELTVEFVAWLRAMRVFDSTDELVAAITANIEWVRANL